MGKEICDWKWNGNWIKRGNWVEVMKLMNWSEWVIDMKGLKVNFDNNGGNE